MRPPLATGTCPCASSSQCGAHSLRHTGRRRSRWPPRRRVRGCRLPACCQPTVYVQHGLHAQGRATVVDDCSAMVCSVSVLYVRHLACCCCAANAKCNVRQSDVVCLSHTCLGHTLSAAILSPTLASATGCTETAAWLPCSDNRACGARLAVTAASW